jgi:UDP-N-acetylglucosamine 4,6-dehydratase/5-epimerase
MAVKRPYDDVYGMTYDKKILITGGTGTFGKRCVRYLVDNCDPERIIVYSRDEVKQFEMMKEFPESKIKKEVRYFLGDIRDRDRLLEAFKGVDLIIHTAAMKQVPACEYNPMEAIKTNILGGQAIIQAALEREVHKVIVLSTDKAADPVNLYGATKLAMEKVFIASNTYSDRKKGPHFSIVRYGNVLGSRSSVLLTFREQKEKGCLKLTDSRMTRFWITATAAVKFVLNRLADMKGGEIFVPTMPSCPVEFLARAVAQGCKIEEVGARPGEKIHEVLVSSNEAPRAYLQNAHYIILPEIKFFERDWSVDTTKILGKPYTSETNEWQLSYEEIEAMAENHEV